MSSKPNLFLFVLLFALNGPLHVAAGPSDDSSPITTERTIISTDRVTEAAVGDEDRPFWPLFKKVIRGDDVGRRVFEELLAAEPEVFRAAARWARETPGSDDRAELREETVSELVDQWKRVVKVRGKQLDKARDRGLRGLTTRATAEVRRSVSALLFIRGVLGDDVPAYVGNAQRALMRFGYNPFKYAKGAKGRSLETLQTRQAIARFGLRAASGDSELEDAIYVATFFRDWATAKDLAIKASRADDLSNETYFLAAHALLARGNGADPGEENAALRLLQLDGSVQKKIASFELGSEPIGEVAIREMALQTLMAMNGIDPAAQENLKETRPNCPIARAVSVFRVKDNSAWPRIVEHWRPRIVQRWKKRVASNAAPERDEAAGED